MAHFDVRRAPRACLRLRDERTQRGHRYSVAIDPTETFDRYFLSEKLKDREHRREWELQDRRHQQRGCRAVPAHPHPRSISHLPWLQARSSCAIGQCREGLVKGRKDSCLADSRRDLVSVHV